MLYPVRSWYGTLPGKVPPVTPRPEILAPAGDRDALSAALAAGADAVYFGLDDGFNARARAENFSSQNLPEIVTWSHCEWAGIRVLALEFATEDASRDWTKSTSMTQKNKRALVEHVVQLGARRLVPIAVEPRRRAVVLGPDQAVTHHLQPFPAGEIDEGIDLREVPLPLGGLDRRRLHAVLRRDDPELGQQERVVCGALGDAVIHPDADIKVVFRRALETTPGWRVRGLRVCGTRRGDGKYDQDTRKGLKSCHGQGPR